LGSLFNGPVGIQLSPGVSNAIYIFSLKFLKYDSPLQIGDDLVRPISLAKQLFNGVGNNVGDVDCVVVRVGAHFAEHLIGTTLQE
jgi:hypothetical protein